MLRCLLLLALLPFGETGLIQCNTRGRDITADGSELYCPKGCLTLAATVWGTDIYTDDSSICCAAIHAGIITDAGGKIRIEKKPGQSSYKESTRNGVTTRSYGAWPESFILTSLPPDSIVSVECNTNARSFSSGPVEVLCPEGCLTAGTAVWGTGIYTDDSSICRAAIHDGKLTNAGGNVTFEKQPGQSSYQESTRNGITTRSYGAYSGSFILTSKTIVPPTSPPPPHIVSVECSTNARPFSSGSVEVLCPAGCLTAGTAVWGTNIYTDDSSICHAAIHDGKLTNAGGQVKFEKKPGQSSYQESTRNGVTTMSYGAYSGSFVLTSETIVIPPTSPPPPPIVSVECNTNARSFSSGPVEVLCPEGCLTAGTAVWGTVIYTDDSSICRAAIHDGKLTNAGGKVTFDKKPGQSSYQESTRNGVTTRSYGAYSGSFILTSETIVIPPTSPPPPHIAAVECNTNARSFSSGPVEVLCPEGCLTAGTAVWGTGIYTDDSSICRAAIHDGRLTNAGGKVTFEKKPGQSSYQESTRNGVTTRSYGAYSGSFILTSKTIVIPPTSPPPPHIGNAVPVKCNTQSKDLPNITTEVLCPKNCLAQAVTVWGTGIYTDDSSICRAAIHAGILTDAGGQVTVEKKPGQNSYQESTQNGVTTRSYGVWSGSFILTGNTTATLPTTPTHTAIVPVQCNTRAKDLTGTKIIVLCPEKCLTQEFPVWGTDIYTDDSSICRAAVHAGILDDAGGNIAVEKKSGQSSYQESTRNGVTTRSYGAWTGSFILTLDTIVRPPTRPPLTHIIPITCQTQAKLLNHNQTDVLCPVGCLTTSTTVWGTDIYTDDSPICSSAIHAGILTDAGGRVRVVKRPGQSSYQESTWNGVTTSSYGARSGSFSVTSLPQDPAVLIRCETQDIFDGNETEVLCPEGCLSQDAAVWGTDIYTHDSSICRSAIHAGKITNAGGRVTVEKRPGQNSYAGSTRNGVKTRDYGPWPMSFIFPPSISKVPDECIQTEKKLSPGTAEENQKEGDAEIHIGK